MASEIFRRLLSQATPEDRRYVEKNLAISYQVHDILETHPTIKTQKALAEALGMALILGPSSSAHGHLPRDDHFAPIIECPDGPSDARNATVEGARPLGSITGLSGRSRRRVER